VYIITNRWYVIAASSELRGKKPVGLVRFGENLVLWRDAEGVAHAAADLCPHRRVRLSPGRLVDGCLECPFHGFRYDGTGACTLMPAHPERKIPQTMSLKKVPLREAHGLIYMWTGTGEPAGEVPFFDELKGMYWHGAQVMINAVCHYTRAIENQLDFAHLKFVHRNTIGRFAKTVVDVESEVQGDRIAAQLEGDTSFGICFLGPNLWIIRLGRSTQMLAFIPVSDEKTRYLVRSYRPTKGLPIIRDVVDYISSRANVPILGQDIRVVGTHPLDETRLRMGEVLVPSDIPIVQYRRWREAHRGAWSLSTDDEGERATDQ